MMNAIGKGMLIVLVVLYIISPIDLVVGPIDDVIVLLFWLVVAKKTGKKNFTK